MHVILRDLNVFLRCYDILLERGVPDFVVMASGITITHGLSQLTADVSD